MNNPTNNFEQTNTYNETRISEEDRLYCEIQQRLYKEMLDATQVAIDAMEKLYEKIPKVNEYGLNASSIYRDIKSIKRRGAEFKRSFINCIFMYFIDKYKVSLTIPGAEKKYTTKVTYSELLDEIFEQLGGYNFHNFQERASKEIIDNCKDTVYRKDKITIKKNILSIAEFVCWRDNYSNYLKDNYSDYKELAWHDSKVIPLFKGLGHYETGNINTLHYYDNLYEKLREGEERHDIFQIFETDYNLVQFIKFYKNGRIDIVFESSEHANEFAITYLGYNH